MYAVLYSKPINGKWDGGDQGGGGGGGGGGRRREKNEKEGRNRRKGGNYIINCGFGVSCNDKLNFIKKLL